MKHKKPKYLHVYLRNGKPYIYFRRHHQIVRLPEPLYSEAFWVAYHHELAGEHFTQPIDKAKIDHGSFNYLIIQYYGSHYFTAQAASTRATYRGQIEAFRNKHGDKKVARITVSHIDAILGEMAKKSTAQAAKFRKRLSMLLKLSVKWAMRSDNPMVHVDPVKHIEKGYRTWTEDDIAKYQSYWSEGSPQRIAMEVLLNTGLRRSDAVRLSRVHVDKDNWVTLTTKKSQGVVELHFPLTAELRRHLAYVPPTSLNFISKQTGGARSEKAFTNWIREAAIEAGLPSDSSPHGLRSAACSRLAEAGCTTLQIMSITGHRSISEVERYTKAASQKRLAKAAMDTMDAVDHENTQETKNG